VIVFDKEGKKLLTTEPIVFPDWVSVPKTYGRSFDSTARLQKGELFLVWQARGWYAGGAPPPPALEKAARKNSSGVFRVDLDTGKPVALEVEQLPKGLPMQVPGELAVAKVGERMFSLGFNAGSKPFQQRRTLKMSGAAGTSWEREIAAPVYLPPLP
jgi:hypothetical protein